MRPARQSMRNMGPLGPLAPRRELSSHPGHRRCVLCSFGPKQEWSSPMGSGVAWAGGVPMTSVVPSIGMIKTDIHAERAGGALGSDDGGGAQVSQALLSAGGGKFDKKGGRTAQVSGRSSARFCCMSSSRAASLRRSYCSNRSSSASFRFSSASDFSSAASFLRLPLRTLCRARGGAGAWEERIARRRGKWRWLRRAKWQLTCF